MIVQAPTATSVFADANMHMTAGMAMMLQNSASSFAGEALRHGSYGNATCL